MLNKDQKYTKGFDIYSGAKGYIIVKLNLNFWDWDFCILCTEYTVVCDTMQLVVGERFRFGKTKTDFEL